MPIFFNNNVLRQAVPAGFVKSGSYCMVCYVMQLLQGVLRPAVTAGSVLLLVSAESVLHAVSPGSDFHAVTA